MKAPIIWIVIKSNKNNLLFILLLLSVSLLYNYPQILTHRPYSIHQWRQTDCLSITMNYYQENRSFFEPAIHWQGTGNGKTVSEFPIIYYTVAKLWKVFGYHEYLFRLVNILIVFLGLFCLYKLILGLLDDVFWALTTTFFVFTSPILVYYSNNFLADAPGFGFSLIGCFFLWKGFEKQKKWWFYSSFLFFLLAGLIKLSSLIPFFAILVTHLYAVLFYKKERGWFYKWYNILPYLVTIILVISWYKYAIYYNEKNMNGIFLLGLFPMWHMDLAGIKANWLNLRKDLLPAYFNLKALNLLLVLFILSFSFYKKVNKVILFMSILIFIGIIAFMVLFYEAFTVHDYYLLNLLFFIPLPILIMLEMLKRNYTHLFQSKALKIFMFCTVLLLSYETAVINRMKYSTNDALVKTNFVVSKGTLDEWTGFHSNYAEHFNAYETITPYLRKIGLKRTDRVLCLQDGSINISLYLMDQKGYTDFGYGEKPTDQRIQFYKDNGVKYFITDTSFLNRRPELKPFLLAKIGIYNNIDIYKL